MNTSVVTVKGQVVIPSKLRRKYGIHNGTLIHFYEQGSEIRLVPVTHAVIDANLGFLRTGGKLKAALEIEKKQERER